MFSPDSINYVTYIRLYNLPSRAHQLHRQFYVGTQRIKCDGRLLIDFEAHRRNPLTYFKAQNWEITVIRIIAENNRWY